MTAPLADISALDARLLAVFDMEGHRGQDIESWVIEFVRRGKLWFEPADCEAAVAHLYSVAEQQFLSAPFCFSPVEVADEYLEAMSTGEAA